MTSGAWICLQYHDGLTLWCVPRENKTPFTESERAQKWRLSLASLLFFTVLLSDHLWFCAEANLTRTRDTEQEDTFPVSMDAYLSSADYPDVLFTPPPSSRDNDIFLGNSVRPLWRLKNCHLLRPSGQCFNAEDPEHVCDSLGENIGNKSTSTNFSDLYLSFCNSYSMSELFSGLSSPESLNCSLEVIMDGDTNGCIRCLQAYQRYDHRAQEKYEEFEMLLQKYLQSDEYSVRACADECKMFYKFWLCSQYFDVPQNQCWKRIPCKQYCLEVQKRCPFVLPDNDDHTYGGLPSFICTGLLELYPVSSEPECCDVRWGLVSDSRHKGPAKSLDSTKCHGKSLTTSAASRLGNNKLKLCVLFLILLHTVVTVSVAQNSTGLGTECITTLEDSSTREE